jgi:hypothetical protein
MTPETSGIEILSRGSKSYSGRWSIKGPDMTVAIVGVATKTVAVGTSMQMPRGLVRRVMGQMIDRFEIQRRR